MIIYLEDKRREAATWVPKLQHLVAGVPLFLTGMNKLSGDGAEQIMAVVEVMVAVMVCGAFAKEVRAARHHAKTGRATHSPVGWFDLAAGVLLIFEAYHGVHHKPAYLRPQFTSGVLTLALGLFHARLHSFHRRRHYLKLDEAGLEFRLAPFQRWKAEWTELASVDLGPTHATLHLKDGRQHKIGLKRFRNGAELRKAIAEHASPAGLLSQVGQAVSPASDSQEDLS